VREVVNALEPLCESKATSTAATTTAAAAPAQA